MANTSAIRAGRAFVELFADDSMLVRTLRRAESRVVTFGNHIKAIGRRLLTLGLGLSIPIAASIKTFAEFDDMMRAVKAAVNATGDEFVQLTAKAKLLGRTISFTATQVAAAMLELARAGFNPRNIDVAIATLLDLARATGTNLAEATDIAVNSMYSFELPATEMTRVCDVMVAAANGAAMTLEDLGYSMSYCAPIAKEYGLTLEDTCKIIGALSNYGIKASQAGTTFRRILTNLADADIQKRLRGLGVDVVDYDTGKMRDVAAVLRDLGKATEQMPKDKKLTLFKELFGLWAIAGGAKLTVAQFDYLIEEIDKAGGTARRTAQEMDAGIGGSMRRMWSVVEGVAIAIGGALAPSLKKLTDWWVKATSGVIAYIDKNRELIVQAAKYTSILIGIGAALFTLGLGFLAVGKVIGAIAMSLAGMGRVVLSVFGLIDGVLNVIKFTVGSFASVFGGIASSIGSVFSVITSVIRGVFSFFATIASIVVTVMGTIAHIVIGTIIAIVHDLFLIARAVTAVVTVLAPIITTVITALATALVTCISFIISSLMPIFTALLGAMVPLISTCITAFTLIAAAVSGAFTSIMTIIISSFIIVGNAIVSIVTGMVAFLAPPILAFCAAIVTAIGTAIAALVSFVSTAVLAVVSFIASVLASVVAVAGIAIAGVIQAIGMGIASVLSAMAPILVVLLTLAAAAEAVYQIISNLSTIGSVIAALFNGLVNIVANCFDIIGTLILRFVAMIASPLINCFSWIVSGLWDMVRQVGAIVTTAVGNVVTSIRNAFASAWSGLISTFNTVFTMLGEIITGFGNFFLDVFNKIGTAIGWLKERFGSLCSSATETYGAVVAALSRGDIEAAIGVIWATLKLIWVQGATSLLSTWYWVVETLQLAWTTCVFKIAEILTTAWYGVQQFWTETVYTMQTLWTEFSNGIISGWKRAEQAIAQGIGWIMARIEGLDPNEMANMINEDYNRQTQQRESERTQRLNEIEQNRNQKTASLQSEKEGTLANLNTDFENAAKVRYPEHEAKIADQEQELAKAKATYQDAINRAKNPPPTPEGTEPESLADKLKQKVNEFASGLNLGDKVSVTGSFSAAAMQSMGISSTMDRVAKATEKSEKHLEKLVNKDAKPDKQNVQKKEIDSESDGDNLTVKELKQHTRFLRDISERGFSSKFS